jgi:hypothetical protein
LARVELFNFREKRVARPRRISIAWRMTFGMLLLCTLFSSARANDECFKGSSDDWDKVILGPEGTNLSKEYLLGIDALLVTINVRFFPDGKVCGMGYFQDVAIRFEGDNYSKKQLRFSFLPIPPAPEKAAPDKDRENSDDQHAKHGRHLEEYAQALFAQRLSGTAVKGIKNGLIIWDGKVRGSDGRDIEVYFKRTGPTARKPAASNDAACGTDGQCDPLSFSVVVKKGYKNTFLNEAKRLPISTIFEHELNKPSDLPSYQGPGYCPDNDVVVGPGETCFEGEAWPFEENNVVSTLNKRSYIHRAQRAGGGAGDDGETNYLESDLLLSRNLRLNLAVAEPLFNDAIKKYFGDTGPVISDLIYMKNSLFWELKGPRFKFEKKSNPSPSDESEWWKVRLQVAVTELNGGTYALTVGMPTTRITFWALSTVPDDAKFTTELDDDERFLDLQGRLMVALTKFVPMSQEHR